MLNVALNFQAEILSTGCNRALMICDSLTELYNNSFPRLGYKKEYFDRMLSMLLSYKESILRIREAIRHDPIRHEELSRQLDSIIITLEKYQDCPVTISSITHSMEDRLVGLYQLIMRKCEEIRQTFNYRQQDKKIESYLKSIDNKLKSFEAAYKGGKRNKQMRVDLSRLLDTVAEYEYNLMQENEKRNFQNIEEIQVSLVKLIQRKVGKVVTHHYEKQIQIIADIFELFPSADHFKWFLTGGHFVLLDGGHYYNKWTANKRVDKKFLFERISSHESCAGSKQYAARGPIPEFLFGIKPMRFPVFGTSASMYVTWFQCEAHSAGLLQVGNHMLDFLKYRITGKNIGPLGSCEFNDKKPIILGCYGHSAEQLAQHTSNQFLCEVI
jgi:hypothetical protein